MMQMYPDYHHHHHPQAQYPHHPQLTDTTSMNGFSRGSSTSFSYGHQEYRYFVDRGGGGEFGSSSSSSSSRLCPTSLVDNNNALDAAGIGFAGNNDASSGSNPFVIPEDISVYSTSSNQWNWTQPDPPPPILAPAPLYPPFSLKSPPPPLVCSPTAQLPTPAAMAVLLNPNAQHTDFDEIPQGSAAAIHTTTTITARPNVIRPVEPVVLAVQSVPDSPSREKKHACTMCHKRFDRPSTLRKHLLVHTGEKAHVCDTCGRRFGVASNLNRHVKRCILKPVNSSSSSSHKSSSGSPPANSSPITSSSPSTSTPTLPQQQQHDSNNVSAVSNRRGKRAARVISSPADNNNNNASCSSTTATTSVSTTAAPKPPGQKRRRRAPSPSQWIPGTLLNFNLHSEDSYRATTVPLPPVRRNLPREERNSWDENVNHTPYHPGGWSGTLPGPGFGQGIGLGGKDVRNVNFGGRGGFMLGRVLVF